MIPSPRYRSLQEYVSLCKDSFDSFLTLSQKTLRFLTEWNTTSYAFIRLYLGEENLEQRLLPYYEKHRESKLFGVFFGVKDVLPIKNFPLSFGIEPAPLSVSEETDPLVKHFRSRGAFVIGSTNLDPLGVSAIGMNERFGMVANPSFPSFVSGGSSSGSASAVAAGAVPFALGADSAGSVRIPASCCGICSLVVSDVKELSDSASQRVPKYGFGMERYGIFTRTLLDLDSLLYPESDVKAAPSPSSFSLLLPHSEDLSSLELDIRTIWDQAVEKLSGALPCETLDFSLKFSEINEMNRVLVASSAREFALSHDVLEDNQSIRERVAAVVHYAQSISKSERESAKNLQAEKQAFYRALLNENTFLLLPTLCSPPPRTVDQTRPLHKERFSKLGVYMGLSPFAGINAVSFPLHSDLGEWPYSLQLCGGGRSIRKLVLVAEELRRVLVERDVGVH